MDQITARGNQTPLAVFFKSESHKLHIQGFAKGLQITATASAALVTGNSIAGTVNGVALSSTAFEVDSDTTMAKLAAKIAAVAGVKSATVTEVAGNTSDDRVIVVLPEDPNQVIAMSFTVTGGASQATFTVAAADNRVYKGMPVKIDTDGYIVPLGTSAHDPNCIGYSVHDAGYEDPVTIIARGYVQEWGIADGTVTPGPVKYTSWDAATGRPKFSSSSVDQATFSGWAMKGAADTALVPVVAR